MRGAVNFWASSQIFMMHIKQHSSGDLCFSPTYSLLCSVSIPVEAARSHTDLQESNRFHTLNAAVAMTRRLATWKHDRHLRGRCTAKLTSRFYIPAALHQLQAHYPATEDVHPLSTHMQHFGLVWVHEPAQKIALHQRQKKINPLNTSKISHNDLNFTYCVSILLLSFCIFLNSWESCSNCTK